MQLLPHPTPLTTGIYYGFRLNEGTISCLLHAQQFCFLNRTKKSGLRDQLHVDVGRDIIALSQSRPAARLRWREELKKPNYFTAFCHRDGMWVCAGLSDFEIRSRRKFPLTS